MRWRWCGIGAAVLGVSGIVACAQTPSTQPSPSIPIPTHLSPADASSDSPTILPNDLINPDPPKFLLLPPDNESVYAPPTPPREEDGVNNGGVNIDLATRYLTDFVYRGISYNRASGGDIHAANFQIETQLAFDLGKLPHPYIGVFSNLNDSDPVSRFQEVRPFFGMLYTLRPLIFNLGDNTYLYPERENLDPSPNTSEVFLQITLDDSYYFLTPHPILSPYIYAAYDYKVNNGWYLQAGVRHDFIFEDLGFTLSALADVAYISNFPQQFVTVSPQGSGFQHYDLGMIGTYSLSNLLKIPPRYGDFSLQGYLWYTSKFDNPILANTEVWGGVGLVFKY